MSHIDDTTGKDLIAGQASKAPVGQPPSAVQKYSDVCQNGHYGSVPIRVGPYFIYAGGTRYLEEGDLDDFDVLIPLSKGGIPFSFGKTYNVLAAPLVDYGGVPEDWQEFLEDEVIPLLEEGNRIIAFCVGSHGRTGTFLASLIALLESVEETPDPISAVRTRHCKKAVESIKQADAVYACRGMSVPRRYRREFSLPKFVVKTYGARNKATGAMSVVVSTGVDDAQGAPATEEEDFLWSSVDSAYQPLQDGRGFFGHEGDDDFVIGDFPS